MADRPSGGHDRPKERCSCGMNELVRVTSRRALAIAGLAMVLAGASGCARMRDHQGYLADNQLVESVQPGVDNRDSVAKTLGRPTFTSEFDDKSWYYISRDMRQYGFTRPSATAQNMLVVRFDDVGNVAAVEKRGLEQAVALNMVKDKTPTLGRDKSLLEDIFGNIGRVGGMGAGAGGAGAPTSDNP